MLTYLDLKPRNTVRSVLAEDIDITFGTKWRQHHQDCLFLKFCENEFCVFLFAFYPPHKVDKDQHHAIDKDPHHGIDKDPHHGIDKDPHHGIDKFVQDKLWKSWKL